MTAAPAGLPPVTPQMIANAVNALIEQHGEMALDAVLAVLRHRKVLQKPVATAKIPRLELALHKHAELELREGAVGQLAAFLNEKAVSWSREDKGEMAVFTLSVEVLVGPQQKPEDLS